jgi:tetratricopeptide (TPR) repeat protein
MAFDLNKQLDRAKRYLEKNKLEDAIEAYQSVVTEIPGHIDSLQALGDIHTRLGQPDRAATFYARVFDLLFEARDEHKALALYTRALKSVQQPPERMSRYALLLQKQNRAEESIEQFTQASELFLARGKDEPALDCLDRVAQLDPDNPSRQCAAGELAERVGKTVIARFCARGSFSRRLALRASRAMLQKRWNCSNARNGWFRASAARRWFTRTLCCAAATPPGRSERSSRLLPISTRLLSRRWVKR